MSLRLRNKNKKSVLHKLLRLAGIVREPDLDVSIALRIFLDGASGKAAMTDYIKRAYTLDTSNAYFSQDHLRNIYLP